MRLTIERNVLLRCARNAEGEVVIPEGVTEIAHSAFEGCRWITSVIIPDGVTKIEGCAFYDCIRLESVVIPSSVTEIGTAAFCGCHSLHEVEIPEGITEIDEDTFRDCYSLTKIKLPETLLFIGQSAFESCYLLDNVRLPEGLNSIDDFAFLLCESLSFIEIPSCTNVGACAFGCCSSLKSIVLPQSRGEICDSAFDEEPYRRNEPVLESYLVDKRFYAGEHPLKSPGKSVQDRIERFLSFGITHFVDLTEDGECDPYAHLLPDGVTYCRFPMKKFSVPSDYSFVTTIVECIENALAMDSSSKVYLHGADGIGRTGMVAGCFYVKSGDDYTMSMTKLRITVNRCVKYNIASSIVPFNQDMFVCRYAEFSEPTENLFSLSNSEDVDIDKIPVEIPCRDRVRGSLFGGAVGDALGLDWEEVDLDLQEEHDGLALISDDTQLSAFTALGIIFSETNTAASMLDSITEAYSAWYDRTSGKDQGKGYKYSDYGTWQRLYGDWRYPDATCISALAELTAGGTVHNDSISSGGVMRIAPVGLYGLGDCRFKDIYEMDKMAADIARITHKAPLGYLPAVIVSHVIYRLSTDNAPTRDKMCFYIKEALSVAQKLFPSDEADIDHLRLLFKKTLFLASSNLSCMDSLLLMGEGRNADEAMAMAFYCAIRYFDDFEAAMAAAVYRGGNKDTVAAITGNVLGAAIGYDAIPEKYKNGHRLVDSHAWVLENRLLTVYIADDLWMKKRFSRCKPLFFIS